MEYSFNLQIAAKYGLAESVFLKNISYWVFQNKSNNIHFHDGRYWTFNTQKAFAQLFPFWTRQNLRRVIDSCKKHGLILTGNYNKISYDRTNWYTLSDKGLSLFSILNDLTLVNNNHDLGENQPRDGLEPTKRVVATNQPIPDINTDINTDKDKRKDERKKHVHFDPLNIVLPEWLPKESWIEFVQHRKERKNPLTELASKKSINLLEKMRSEGQDIEAVINTCIANGWKGLHPIKSQGISHGKDSKYYGKNGKFDSMQYLLDSIREDEEAKLRESKENNCLSENDLSSENGKYLQYDGTSIFSY